ncbi:hypothetical protein J4Q44_G00234970 [Coregonus suidteri]|uniref:Uncharacterized protein n=1 Tax=Coregonus suidteri TaxID=861788 RepID=A0AAN8L732_9TELE
MGSLASEVLDEAHCFWAMCPHPCFWELEQRIAKGNPLHINQSQAHQREHNTRLESVDLHFPGFNSVDHSPSDMQHKGVKASPHVAVKELICLLSSKTSKMNRKKSNNVWKRVQFQ